MLVDAHWATNIHYVIKIKYSLSWPYEKMLTSLKLAILCHRSISVHLLMFSRHKRVILNITVSLVTTSTLFGGLERQPTSRLQFGSRDIQHDGHSSLGIYIYLLSALHISITTRTDNAIVLGCGSSKILQSRLGNILGSAGHCMWCVWQSPPRNHVTYPLLYSLCVCVCLCYVMYYG